MGDAPIFYKIEIIVSWDLFLDKNPHPKKSRFLPNSSLIFQKTWDGPLITLNHFRRLRDIQEKIHLIAHLPYLFNLTNHLKENYSYTLDNTDLCQHPSSIGLDITKWYQIWCELDALWSRSDLIYPTRKMIPLGDVILRDVIPTTSSSDTGSTTLNMIRYLSQLHNHLLPDSTPETPCLLTRRYRVLQPDTFDRLIACLSCTDSAHLDNLVHRVFLAPLRKLPTERAVVLNRMKLRTLYTVNDMKSFEEFYSRTQNRELEVSDIRIVDQISDHVSDVWALHKVLTGLIVSDGDFGKNGCESYRFESLTLSTDLRSLIQDRSKLFELYRRVNLFLYVRQLGDVCCDKTYPRHLESFFNNDLFNESCEVPSFGSADKKELAMLLAEFISMFVAFVDPPEKLLGWEVQEALDCYLDRFSGRDPGILTHIDNAFKIENMSFVLLRILCKSFDHP